MTSFLRRFVRLLGVAGLVWLGSVNSVSGEGTPALDLTEAERQWLAAHPEIRLGIDPQWKPFEFVDGEGRYSGMAADHVALLEQLLGIRMRPVEGLSWSEVIERAKRGEIDVLPCVVATEPRREFLDFTEPYLDFPMVVVTRDDASFISDLHDLEGVEVGVVKGYATSDLLRARFPNLILVEFDTLGDGLEKLSLGRIGAFVDNLASITTAIDQRNLTNLKIAARTPFSFRLGIGVRKDWPELTSILDKALRALTEAQTRAIRDRWIRIRFDHGVDLSLVARASLFVGVLTVVVLVMIILWNRRLMSEIQRRTRAERALMRRHHVLELISEQRALPEVLHELVTTAEEECPGLLASVLLYEASTNRLRVGAAPSLPEVYNEAVDGVAVGEGVGSCGHAAFTGKRLIVDDVLAHPNWASYRDLARRAGIRACWSQPILSGSGRLLGTFALYYAEPRSPTQADIEYIEELALQAGMAIEHQRGAEALRKLSLAVEHSPSAVLITDRDGVPEYVNPEFSVITGFTAAEVVGDSSQVLQSAAYDALDGETPWDAMEAGREWRGEVRKRRSDGSWYWSQERVSPIVDPGGTITHFVWLQEDITESKDSNERLAYQARHDALTGLYNRREFERRLTTALGGGGGSEGNRHTLAFLDLDQFKVVNDTVGHGAGDELLRQIGTLLAGRLRQRDTIARFGGDEFAILMEHCTAEQARDKLETLRRAVEEHRFTWEGRMFDVGVSMGVAMVTAGTHSVSDALRHADIACYAAKDAGRNRIHVYDAAADASTTPAGDMLWATRISRALKDDRFSLFVQPLVATARPDVPVEYEVLLRMNDDDGSLLNPGAFLPAAERYNLATRIDRWVIDTLIDWCAAHPGVPGDGIAFAVNLSGQSLGDEVLLAHIVSRLRAGDIAGSRLKFEITETAAISNLAQANTFVSTLRELGIAFSLDDFGSGLSSFGYLKSFEVDALKIDGMFVRDILDDAIDAAMVKSINDIGQVMGKKTIAEFVENEAILARLCEIGVDYAQGYAIGRPAPIETLLDRPGESPSARTGTSAG